MHDGALCVRTPPHPLVRGRSHSLQRVCMYEWASMRMRMSACMYACTCVDVFACVCACACAYECTRVRVCVWPIFFFYYTCIHRWLAVATISVSIQPCVYLCVCA
eukprot:GDKI01013905.1.p2 GENE.GDKI01013905.1~~GDKI01013905.1.p2  ORF type:complete len:105 (-),score=26.69 GDKI01013905.1:402-716(-)